MLLDAPQARVLSASSGSAQGALGSDIVLWPVLGALGPAVVARLGVTGTRVGVFLGVSVSS